MEPGACIELIDAHGNAEDGLVLVGSGTSVSLVEDEHHQVRMEPFSSDHDLASLRLCADGSVEILLIQCKFVRDDRRQLAERRLQVAPATQLELWFDALATSVRVRPIANPHAFPGCEVLSAVFRPHGDDTDQAARSLRSWAEASMHRGMEEVHARLERLRRAGVIDADDRRIVDLPADLRPGSRSDV